MKYCFLKTSDEETKNTLLSLGFKLQSQDNGVYTFINDSKMSFDDKKLKVAYSNVLTF